MLDATGSTLYLLVQSPADAEAWARFVGRYGPKIYGWCCRWGLQEADAQDVTQAVLTKLVRTMSKFRYDPRKGLFRQWLKTVTHNAWKDFIEERRRPAGSGAPDVLEQLQSVAAREELEDSLEQEHKAELLEAAMARVQVTASPRDWDIFTALALGGQPGKAVAAKHAMTVAAVFMVKSRIQQKLRDEVDRLGG